MEVRPCAYCGTDYEAPRRNSRYCCSSCKEKARYYRNVEKSRGRSIAYYRSHRERRLEYGRGYREANRAALNAACRANYAKRRAAAGA